MELLKKLKINDKMQNTVRGNYMKKTLKTIIILIIVVVLLITFLKLVEKGYDEIVSVKCTPCYYGINDINFDGCCDSFHNIFQKTIIVFKYYIFK